MTPRRLWDRREFVAGALSLAASRRAAAAPEPFRLRVRDDLAPFAISREIYGSNEIGTMDGGAPSATLDRRAGVTARRLGGNLMTTYNWINNAANAGRDWKNANGDFWLHALNIPREQWSHPAIVIETMHEASLAMGASSLVTLPIQGYVAADFSGPIDPAEGAPSRRFAEVDWRTDAAPGVSDPRLCNIPQLLARLIAKYGRAGSPRGIGAYALDNEPALWPRTHARIQHEPPTVRRFLERSIAAARVIKSLDPAARVHGPVSWGASEMVDFQSAPDWRDYSGRGSFLAVYLDAFKQASEKDGRRLLDALDIHWYAFSSKGDLYRSEKPEHDDVKLDAPRSLDEPGFVEDSWVPRALRGAEGLGLPILPSLRKLIEHRFPGTSLAVTEFNYGGPGRLASGLALADALGRMGRSGVDYGAHWGSLDGWLGEAYRLYREPDAVAGAFGDQGLAVETSGGPAISAFAARDAKRQAPHLVVINKSETELAVDVGFAARTGLAPKAAIGFDADQRATGPTPLHAEPADGATRMVLPPRSARRIAFA